MAGCAAPCPLTAQQFVRDGVLGPFVVGQATGTGNQVRGGDGSYSEFSTALVGFKTDQAYGRFEYDVTDSVNFYASASWARQTGAGTWFPSKLNPVSGTATTANSLGSTFFKNNPFLTPAVQAALGNNGQFDSSNVFSLGQAGGARRARSVDWKVKRTHTDRPASVQQPLSTTPAALGATPPALAPPNTKRRQNLSPNSSTW